MPERAIEFRKMTEEEFPKYIQSSLESYTQDIARNFKRPIDEVKVESKDQVNRILKDGLSTTGHSLFNVADKGTGETVGSVWVHVDEAKKRAFLYDIIVYQRFRGMGYGRKIMELLEETLRQMNVVSIALHVFADNSTAINLYKTQGYHTASFNMQKDL